jgi:hypothetical protein
MPASTLSGGLLAGAQGAGALAGVGPAGRGEGSLQGAALPSFGACTGSPHADASAVPFGPVPSLGPLAAGASAGVVVVAAPTAAVTHGPLGAAAPAIGAGTGVEPVADTTDGAAVAAMPAAVAPLAPGQSIAVQVPSTVAADAGAFAAMLDRRVVSFAPDITSLHLSFDGADWPVAAMVFRREAGGLRVDIQAPSALRQGLADRIEPLRRRLRDQGIDVESIALTDDDGH